MAGPGELTLMAIAVMNINGEQRINPTSDPTISMILLKVF
jgi:hypothetical protein